MDQLQKKEGVCNLARVSYNYSDSGINNNNYALPGSLVAIPGALPLGHHWGNQRSVTARFHWRRAAGWLTARTTLLCHFLIVKISHFDSVVKTLGDGSLAKRAVNVVPTKGHGSGEFQYLCEGASV